MNPSQSQEQMAGRAEEFVVIPSVKSSLIHGAELLGLIILPA
jgi:hypothetical protein